MRLHTLLCSLMFVGCASDPTVSLIDLELGTPAGGALLGPTDEGMIEVWVRHGDAAPQRLAAEVRAGTFELRVPVSDPTERWVVGAALQLADRRLLGATPEFFPIDTGGYARLMLGEPGGCATVAGVELDMARVDAGSSLMGSFAPIFGGAEGVRPWAYFDLLRWAFSHDLEPASVDGLGATRTMRLSDRFILVLSAQEVPLLFDLMTPGDRVQPVALHAGAGIDSTLILSSNGGGWVIGGGLRDGSVAGLSHIDASGVVTLHSMTRPRSAPAALQIAEGLLIVGGGRPGEGSAELLMNGETNADVVWEDPLLADRWGASAMGAGSFALFGGVGGEGRAHASTLWVEGCPVECSASAGEDWETPRVDFTSAIVHGDLYFVGGADASGALSPLIERVTLEDGRLRFFPAYTMASPRAHASAVGFGGGQMVIIGGRGSSGARRDVELCVSQELSAVTF